MNLWLPENAVFQFFLSSFLRFLAPAVSARAKITMVYLYRAVGKAGQTVDFFLSRNRDVNAAKSFLRNAMKNTRVPTKITLDSYAASHRAVREMKEDGDFRVTSRFDPAIT